MAIVMMDLDGVIYRFSEAFQLHIKRCKPHLFSGDHTLDPDTWDWFTDWGMSRAEFVAEMDCGVNNMELFWRGRLYEEDIPKQIRRLQDMGHFVHVVTHRYSGTGIYTSEEATRFWLQTESGIFPDQITYAEDKTSVPSHYSIEDRIVNYDALVASGSIALLVNRPYNQPETDGRNRVSTVKEFVDLVLQLEGE